MDKNSELPKPDRFASHHVLPRFLQGLNGPYYTQAPRTRQRRSVYLRHIDCGSCGACERELETLENPVYDMQRLGLEFRSTPRQAHLLLLTGPYTRNMDLPTWQALQVMAQRFSKITTSNPRLGCIVLVGDCACSGGIFEHAYGRIQRPAAIQVEVIAEISGCPPTPSEILGSLEILAQYLEEWEKGRATVPDIPPDVPLTIRGMA